ncbi:MAG TPA: hypothetical protein VEA60_13960 [Allosphingosinicella sp.]|nr:hypothetical protein [Allosphingosinicella sp.]
MNKYVVDTDIESIFLGQRRVPAIVLWNRLEGSPRRTDFSRALKAEARDPLWLLTRQWQMGEFIGEDAGSPVSAKVAWRTDAIDQVLGRGGAAGPYDPAVPLEAVVEARPVPLRRDERVHNADLRLMLGRRWAKLLDKAGHGALLGDFEGQYGFAAPDPSLEADFPLTAAAANWQFLAAIATRALDGGGLLLHLERPGALASDGLGLAAGTQKDEIDDLGRSFMAWARQLHFQPDPALDSWRPRQLEYGFGLSAPIAAEAGELSAKEYHGGRLDWFHFDAVATTRGGPAGPPPALEATSFMPVPVQFEGMPNTRHWTFEEGAINFGDISPDTTDLSKLLLVEFGLVFANDWFLVPLTLPVGSLTAIRGLAVTNVFGERTWIEPAVTAAGPVQSWRMFRLTDKGAPDDRLFLPAAAAGGLQSAPVEAVDFVRDEVSNMVWGIERIVQLADGSSRRGREVALELHARYQGAVLPVPSAAPANDAKVRYSLMTSVAEHWIPFIPVHLDGDNREIQLQRAAMPRLLEGEEGVDPERIAPRTALLREGLDALAPVSYFINEEEIGRAGTVVETRWQRCRWTDGRVVTWLGIQRSTGRGGSSSGLAFDILLPKSAA